MPDCFMRGGERKKRKRKKERKRKKYEKKKSRNADTKSNTRVDPLLANIV